MLQRTPEWFQARVGKVTASRMADVMAELVDKKKEAVGRRNYRRELALERFTNVPQESGYTSFAMLQGIEKEAAARDAYAFAKGVDVEEVGFIVHPKIKDAGASPDGLIGTDGLLEIAGAERPASEVADIAKKFTVQVYCQGISQKTASGSAGPLALSPSDVADFGTKVEQATPGQGSTRP